MKKLAAFLLLLALVGCDNAAELKAVQEENAKLEQEIRQMAPALPVIEERRMRIRKLDEEIARVQAEIAQLEKKRKPGK